MPSKEEEKVLRVSNYAKDPTKSYGGKSFYSGYHDLKLKGNVYKGQRDNSVRLSNIKYDFKDKVVLDIGCNSGGILHELAPIIKYGVGIDSNYNYINLANLIKDCNQTYNVNFYTFNLDKQNISNISDLVLKDKIDVCFFLSMAKWVKNWIEVVKYCSLISPVLFFETNGSRKEQNTQEKVVRQYYPNTIIVYKQSLDDVSQHDRRLLMGAK